MAIDELEAALRTAWSFDDLAVYGDYLLQSGDLRGELIALDLCPLPDDPRWSGFPGPQRHGRAPAIRMRWRDRALSSHGR